MDTVQIDYFTVVIAAVLNMIIGWLWYSKWLFQKQWMQACHTHKQGCRKECGTSLLYGFIVSLVIAYFLAFFEAYLGVTTVTDGMYVAFCIWLGFVATTQIGCVIWSDKPFKLFLLNTACKLVSYLVMGGIIAA